MNLDLSPVSLLVILQLLLDALLLIGLVLLHRRITAIDATQWEEMSKATEEALRLAEMLEKNLEEKRALVKRIEEAAARLQQKAQREGRAADPRSEAVNLLKKGLSKEEVSERTGLPLEEIELMASLQTTAKGDGWRA